MERDGHESVATFFAPETPVPGAVMSLGDDAAHHMRVRRIAPPERIRLLDGAGTVARGTLARLAKNQASVDVEAVDHVEPLPEVHLLVPVADRERMLWLAEKCTELGLTTWRPVLWRRSRSVSPRGEGIAFQAKVRARMISALEQSGNAWLPSIHPDATPERALAAAPAGSRILLDQAGDPLLAHRPSAPAVIALGPEGGFEPSEREALVAAGFIPASMGSTILRFETAGVAALALVRASLLASETVHVR